MEINILILVCIHYIYSTQKKQINFEHKNWKKKHNLSIIKISELNELNKIIILKATLWWQYIFLVIL